MKNDSGMKVDPFTNMKHADTECRYCKSTSILFDEHRGEIFCEKCGLILHRVSDVLESRWSNL